MGKKKKEKVWVCRPVTYTESQIRNLTFDEPSSTIKEILANSDHPSLRDMVHPNKEIARQAQIRSLRKSVRVVPDNIKITDDTRMLLQAMQNSILIQNSDGHRYITNDVIKYPDGGWDIYGLEEGGYPLNKLLREKGLGEIRGKQYGSFRDCLFEIDDGFKRLGLPTLLEQYYQKGGDQAWGLHND